MSFLPMKCSFLQSFRWAGCGIVNCIRRERNFRIHLTAACYSTALGFRLGISRTEWAVLFLTQAVVLAMELCNTAVEAAVDLCCPERHMLAKRAKDAAAGAVLTAAAFSVAVGFNLFWRPALLELAGELLTSPRLFLTAAASVVLALWFICAFKEKRKTNEV